MSLWFEDNSPPQIDPHEGLDSETGSLSSFAPYILAILGIGITDNDSYDWQTTLAINSLGQDNY